MMVIGIMFYLVDGCEVFILMDGMVFKEFLFVFMIYVIGLGFLDVDLLGFVCLVVGIMVLILSGLCFV